MAVVSENVIQFNRRKTAKKSFRMYMVFVYDGGDCNIYRAGADGEWTMPSTEKLDPDTARAVSVIIEPSTAAEVVQIAKYPEPKSKDSLRTKWSYGIACLPLLLLAVWGLLM